MRKFGQKITDKEIDEIFEKHDTRGDGKLWFDEFEAVFKERIS